MKTGETLESIKESMKRSFKTKRAFGQAYEFDGISVIPVARVKMAAGGGGESGDENSEGKAGGGMGFAGGIRPIGFIRVKNGRATWVPIWDAQEKITLAGISLLGALVALALTRRAAGRAG